MPGKLRAGGPPRFPRLSWWAVAATYMGTVVGAGFASGQEVLRFFTHFGGQGTWGLLVATLLLMTGGTALCELGRRAGSKSYGEALVALVGPALGRALDGVMGFLLFGGLVVMAAGSGALFREHLGLSEWLGSSLLVLAAVVTVAFGMQGVVAANRAVVPLLVLAVLGVSLASLTERGLSPGWDGRFPAAAAYPSWLAAAVLYASYNLFLSLGVLAPLGASISSPRVLATGGMLGGLGLGIVALAVHLAVKSGLPRTADLAIPMLGAVSVLPPWVRAAYAGVLFAEIFTTAVANLFALTRRAGTAGWRSAGLLVGLGLGAFLASRAGFARLVLIVYPLAGYLGIPVLLALPMAFCRRRR